MMLKILTNKFYLLLAATYYYSLALNIESKLTVGVVEYEPLHAPDLTPADKLNGNAANYIELLQSLNGSKVDLLVYPEATLEDGMNWKNLMAYTTYATIGENPCSANKLNYPEHIQRLSCAAQSSTTHLVFNTIEKYKCTKKLGRNCQKYGHYFYNTDIVFNDRGTIIAKYRKYNLYGEFELDRPDIVDYTIFKINGEEFGVFTCFDILFRQPAEDLVKRNVKRFIFPSMWFSQLPFFTSLQVEQMWAYAHNVRLYAAGASNPKRGSGGTGIFNGATGPEIMDIIIKGGSRIYTHNETNPVISPAPASAKDIDVLAKEMQNFRLTADTTVYKGTSKVLEFSNGKVVKRELCHKGVTSSFCCKFTIEAVEEDIATGGDFDRYTYQMVAYSGVKSFVGIRKGGVDFCAVLACLNSSITSCGHRFANYETIKWPVTFTKIVVEANFTANSNTTQYPTSLLSSIRPVNPEFTSWTWKEQKGFIERRFASTRPQNRLMVFGILGRNFDLDTESLESNSNGCLLNNVILGAAVVTAVYAFYTYRMV